MGYRFLALDGLSSVNSLLKFVKAIKSKHFCRRSAANSKINLGDNSVNTIRADKQPGQIGTICIPLEMDVAGCLV